MWYKNIFQSYDDNCINLFTIGDVILDTSRVCSDISMQQELKLELCMAGPQEGSKEAAFSGVL